MSTMNYQTILLILVVLACTFDSLTAFPRYVRKDKKRNVKNAIDPQVLKESFCLNSTDCDEPEYFCNQKTHHCQKKTSVGACTKLSDCGDRQICNKASQCEFVKDMTTFKIYQEAKCLKLKSPCSTDIECGSCDGQPLMCDEDKTCVYQKPKKKSRGEYCTEHSECGINDDYCFNHTCTEMTFDILNEMKKDLLKADHLASFRCKQVAACQPNKNKSEIQLIKLHLYQCIRKTYRMYCKQDSDCQICSRKQALNSSHDTHRYPVTQMQCINNECRPTDTFIKTALASPK